MNKLDLKLTKTPYRQLFANENDELFVAFIKDPLMWTIYTLCAMRARRSSTPSPDGLEQGEFWLSEMEYAKFGLKKSQRGQITRRLKMIQKRFGLVSKTEKRIGNEKANVYRLESNKLININPEIESDIEKKQRANRERIETNKNDNKLAYAANNLKSHEWLNRSTPHNETNAFPDQKQAIEKLGEILKENLITDEAGNIYRKTKSGKSKITNPAKYLSRIEADNTKRTFQKNTVDEFATRPYMQNGNWHIPYMENGQLKEKILSEEDYIKKVNGGNL